MWLKYNSRPRVAFSDSKDCYILLVFLSFLPATDFRRSWTDFRETLPCTLRGMFS